MAGFYASAAAGAPLADAARLASLAWLDGPDGTGSSIRPTYPRGSKVIDPAHPLLWANYACLGDDGGPLPSLPRR